MPRSECQTGLRYDVGPEALFLQSLQMLEIFHEIYACSSFTMNLVLYNHS